MRLRLFHKIFLLIAMSAIITAVAVALLLAINLNSGFSEYLAARDQQELIEFTDQAEARLQALGGLTAIRTGKVELATVLPFTAPRHAAGFTRPPPPPGNLGEIGGNRPLPPRPNGAPPESFEVRLVLFDHAGKQLAGPHLPLDDSIIVKKHPIILDGKEVASIAVLPRGPAPSAIDSKFLQRQFMGALLLTGLLILLASLAAYLFAKRSARTLQMMGSATKSIAGGNFAARLELTGHDEISEMAENINKMVESLDAMQTARRRSLADIGHELRTPLSVLSGELEALRDGIRPLNDKAVESLIVETGRMQLLVEDLHFLAENDFGEPAYLFRQENLGDIVNCVVGRVRENLGDSGLMLQVSTNFAHDVMVSWDSDRIGQLFANLLENSRRYTDAPGTVLLDVSVEGACAIISVSDSAPDVSAEHLPRIFDRLYRIEEARDRASGGSGLGLSICAAIADAHNGTIEASPSKLGGLCVAVTLPLLPVNPKGEYR